MPLTVSARSWVAAILIFAMPSYIPALAAFDVVRGQSRYQQGVLVVDADIDLELSDATQEALTKGVDLTIDIQMRLYRHRNWMWDERLAGWLYRIRLSYHALSNRFVAYLPDGGVDTFQSLSEALVALGTFRHVVTLDNDVNTGRPGDYRFAVRVKLDHKRLPPPLKLMATVSPDWRLDSDWNQWPVEF